MAAEQREARFRRRPTRISGQLLQLSLHVGPPCCPLGRRCCVARVSMLCHLDHLGDQLAASIEGWKVEGLSHRLRLAGLPRALVWSLTFLWGH